MINKYIFECTVYYHARPRSEIHIYDILFMYVTYVCTVVASCTKRIHLMSLFLLVQCDHIATLSEQYTHVNRYFL